MHEVDQAVPQTNQVNVFSLHPPNWKHGFQVLRTISLDHPNVNSLENISGGPQHAVQTPIEMVKRARTNQYKNEIKVDSTTQAADAVQTVNISLNVRNNLDSCIILS